MKGNAAVYAFIRIFGWKGSKKATKNYLSYFL